MAQNGKMLALLNIGYGFVDVNYIMLYFTICLKIFKIKSKRKSGEKNLGFPEESQDVKNKGEANRNIRITTAEYCQR